MYGLRRAVVASVALMLSWRCPLRAQVTDSIESWEDWEALSFGYPGIMHVVPGPSPLETGPDGEPVPGPEEAPCLTSVIFGPAIQHINLLRATNLDCVAGFTPDDINRMRDAMTMFRGYVIRMTDPTGGFDRFGVTLHNERVAEPQELQPRHVSYVIRTLRRAFREEALGPLVYYPLVAPARERARRWLDDPSLELDFEILLEEPEGSLFVRGDVTGDREITLGDAVRLLRYLFVDRETRIDCLDAADANDDGVLDLHDPMVVLRYLFLGGAAPAQPFPAPGLDETRNDPWECGP